MAHEVGGVRLVETSAARALWPLGLATALSLMGDSTLYAVLPTHPADAGIALGSIGLVLSVNRIVRLASNGPAGWLFDRLPDRRTVFIGALWLGVLSTTVYALSAGLYPLLAGRLLWGIAWSGIWVAGNAIVLQMAPADRRGRWVGVYQVWFFFGAALGSLLGGLLTDAVGYRQALWIGALVSALGALAANLALTNPRSASAETPAEPSAAAASTRRSWLPDFGAISPALWAVAGAHGINRLVASGVVSGTLGLVVQQNFAGLRIETLQIGVASVTGGLLAARTLVSLVGAPFAGVWSDAAGRRWGLLVISLVLGGVGIGLLALPGASVMVVATFLGAAASGSIQALATALAGDLAVGKRHGSGLGILYTAGDLGSAIGPLAAYALLPWTGLPAIFVGCAVAMLAVAGWVAVAR